MSAACVPSLSLTSTRASERHEILRSRPTPVAAPCTGRQAHRVHGIHVEPELHAQLDGLEQRRLAFVVGLIELPVDPCRRISAVVPANVGMFGSAPCFSSSFNHRHVASQGGGDDGVWP